MAQIDRFHPLIDYRSSMWAGKVVRVAFTLIALCCLFPIAQVQFNSAEASEIYAVNYPPLMIKESQTRPGFAIEIIEEADKRIGAHSTIKYYPFARMEKTLLNRKMAIFPTLYRTPQREKQFLWITKVFKVENAFHTIGFPINSLAAAAKLKSIGVVSKTALQVFLQAKGFNNLDVVTRPELNAQKLAVGRIDAWFLTTFLARMIWEQEDVPSPLVSGVPIMSPDSYIAANVNFPKKLAEKYKNTVEQMHADGTISKIVANYGLAINNDMVIVKP